MADVFVFDTVRTPRASARAQGAFREVRPFRLPAKLLRELGDRNPGMDLARVTDLLLGCVSAVGDQGYNVAQAALQDVAWPDTVGAATVNRYCASGLETVLQAYARITAGLDEAIVAGGLESMSRVPLGAGGGPVLEDPELILSKRLLPQGIAADLIATLRGYTREQLDEYALASHQRAATARAEGHFAHSLIDISDRSSIQLLSEDELIRAGTDAEKLASLRPAFAKTVPARGGGLPSEGFDALALSSYPQLSEISHVHTAGNSSALADGAGLALLGTAGFGEAGGLTPRARVVSVAVASSEPTVMLLGMIPATELALARAGLKASDVDLFEVGEAFAAVPLAFIEHFGVGHDRVNVNGGGIALGDPVGATGTMLLGTVVDELHRRGKRYGLVTLCAAGGQGVACVVERVGGQISTPGASAVSG